MILHTPKASPSRTRFFCGRRVIARRTVYAFQNMTNSAHLSKMKQRPSHRALALCCLLLLGSTQLPAEEPAVCLREDEPGPTEQAAPLANTTPSLQSLAIKMGALSKALATDDFALYQELRKALPQEFQRLAEAEPDLAASLTSTPGDPLPQRNTIKEARQDFARFSTAVTNAVQERKIHVTAKLWIYACPMAPEVGTGLWLQAEPGAKNPFFGAAMLKCGTEIDAPRSE